LNAASRSLTRSVGKKRAAWAIAPPDITGASGEFTSAIIMPKTSSLFGIHPPGGHLMKRYQVNLWLRTQRPENARVEVEALGPDEAYRKGVTICRACRPSVPAEAIQRKNVKEVRSYG
jgi:hypothetical protein